MIRKLIGFMTCFLSPEGYLGEASLTTSLMFAYFVAVHPSVDPEVELHFPWVPVVFEVTLVLICLTLGFAGFYYICKKHCKR